ncbi:hypothetical protein [Anaerosinus massiliensis]|uniref:hypothetical protein n=1 Tax=Massilibacillus massiliensis TaxID=1806837 RepID=UPI0018FEC5AE|nr:hypothetical protein [Massilibacillus massiliensis]
MATRPRKMPKVIRNFHPDNSNNPKLMSTIIEKVLGVKVKCRNITDGECIRQK